MPIGITSYWSKDEKQQIELQAQSHRQSISSWIRDVIKGHLAMKDIKPIMESGDSEEIKGLKEENERLRNEIILLKAPKLDVKGMIKQAKMRDEWGHKILNRLLDAKGHYITTEEFCEMLDIHDEQDYLLFQEAIRYIETPIEFSSRFGYRIR